MPTSTSRPAARASSSSEGREGRDGTGLFHAIEARLAAVPLKRPGRAEELGGTVASLASQQAGFLTGQVLQLDGGMTRSLV